MDIPGGVSAVCALYKECEHMAENISVEIADRFVGFITDWEYEQYLLLGGYGSGKSYAIGQKIILKLLAEKRTALVVRNVKDTIKESCYLLLKEILSNMDMLAEEKGRSKTKQTKVIAVQSPMEFRFPNGSRIIFKGLDNPEKIKSIHGVSIVWIEECSEIRLSAYEELLGRIRTPNISMHFILSCNPVGRENWVYNTFFRRMDETQNKEIVVCDEYKLYKRRTLVCDIGDNRKMYYHHSLPDDNPFLPVGYVKRLNALKTHDMRLWVVARWGRFGAAGTIVLPNFEVAKDKQKFINKVNDISAHYHFFGIDFGFEESFNALVSCCVDNENKDLYIYDEIYVNKVTDDRFSSREDVRRTASRASRCEKIIVGDCAEPKTILFYNQQGIAMRPCRKFAGSRLANTKKLKRFRHIYCSPKCKNAIRELKDLTYKKDSRGNVIYDEFNIDPHIFSALWYALDDYTVADIKDVKRNTRSD